MGNRDEGLVRERRTVSEAKQRHGDCMGALEAVERCVDRSPDGDARWTARLLERLPSLRAAMCEHFENEERGPLHTEMPVTFPHLAEQFTQLRDEHPRLLDAADDVIRRARALNDPQTYELRELDAYVQLLAAKIRRHEAAENELMLEAVYHEIGGRG